MYTTVVFITLIKAYSDSGVIIPTAYSDSGNYTYSIVIVHGVIIPIAYSDSAWCNYTYSIQ